MKKQMTPKLAVVTTTVRHLDAQDLKQIVGGVPPDPCRHPTKNPSGG